MNLPWSYRAQLVRPHDGDSFFVLADLGFYARAEVELRLYGVHAPELGQQGGHETLEMVNGWLTASAGDGRKWPLWIEVVMTTSFEPTMRQSFTRYLATVWRYGRQSVAEESLNWMVNAFLSGHPEWPPGE